MNKRMDGFTSRMDGMNLKVEGAYNELNAKFEHLASHVKSLDNQVAQVASSSKRPIGSLPATTQTNSKDFCNAIITSIESDHEKDVEEISRLLYGVDNEDLVSQREGCTMKEEVTPIIIEKVKAPRDEPPLYEPPIPFPGRILTKAKKKILKSIKATMSNIGVPLPPMNNLLQVPLHLEFIEAILANREKVEEVMESLKPSNAIPLGPKTLPKLKDPGTFTISCSLGNLKLDDALCDSGASVNVMSFEMMKTLELKAMRKYPSSITYADASSKSPLGLIEDYPLLVGDCLIPTDFLIVDRGKPDKLPLILGTPFLHTAGASIDFPNKRVTLINVNPKVSYPIKPSSKNFCGTISNEELEKNKELKVVNKKNQENHKLDEETLDGDCLHSLFVECEERGKDKRVEKTKKFLEKNKREKKQAHPPTLVNSQMTLNPLRCVDGEVDYKVKCKGMSNPFAMVKAILTPELKEKGFKGFQDVMKEVLTINIKGGTRFSNALSTNSTGPRSLTTPLAPLPKTPD